MIVDATCMNLVIKPEQFDVIVTTNLFGDIVSDLCAGLVGGLGMAPGANIGKDIAIFEAVHGSAPDIADQNIANPTSVILASVQMLEHMGMQDTSPANYPCTSTCHCRRQAYHTRLRRYSIHH